MEKQSFMENMVSLQYLKPFFNNKTVLVTGHTGFKGAWLIQILSLMGAKVCGYALKPEHAHDLYNAIDGDSICSSLIADIRNKEEVKNYIVNIQPDFVFHLAAQPLVLKGYEQPLETFDTNVMGTAYVLDALRFIEKRCVAIMITTDKVYENNISKSFNEDDKLGGYDPYSASKAACELLIASYRSSYFNENNFAEHKKSIASVRAGNVIGGGDYAAHRIIPDIVKAIQNNESIKLRNPEATRPWLHVLEPLGVYLLLASKMIDDPISYNTAFNIGPDKNDVLSVKDLVTIAIATSKKGEYEIMQHEKQAHEAPTLMLDITKIKDTLFWTPNYSAKQAIELTMQWYLDTDEAINKCLKQINDYFHNTIENEIERE
ncbi:MAG: CDP-glucose 4,6-dehydratase [Chitinophagaceae bacterium]